ncbi:hypothetical protein Slala05_84480 [Streptomyces lavendulae subsp. lavendulae]|nr:hypothetical protein Slala05_84480 [Streptomyces lavendulae subsp. lavendulae]
MHATTFLATRLLIYAPTDLHDMARLHLWRVGQVHVLTHPLPNVLTGLGRDSFASKRTP